jgi:hypothetical protein
MNVEMRRALAKTTGRSFERVVYLGGRRDREYIAGLRWRVHLDMMRARPRIIALRERVAVLRAEVVKLVGTGAPEYMLRIAKNELADIERELQSLEEDAGLV